MDDSVPRRWVPASALTGLTPLSPDNAAAFTRDIEEMWDPLEDESTGDIQPGGDERTTI